MLLTHSPVQTVTLRSVGNPKEVTAAIDERSLWCATFIDAIVSGPNRSFQITGSRDWVMLKQTVDELTGYRMLEILDSKFEELDKRLFLS